MERAAFSNQAGYCRPHHPKQEGVANMATKENLKTTAKAVGYALGALVASFQLRLEEKSKA